ncbi:MULTISPECIES: hypothetical protein [unclassified Rhodococcus (in: high G+C Gram-positive bacteria)]|uniref:hypothetical protein n=1 Tax=unclassified Rhodococcus (in: high G+C Gram-positive bacteria) TaxID=192944 RepID=UPI0037C79A2B
MASSAYALLIFSELTPGKGIPPVLVFVCMAIAGPSEVIVNPVTLSLVTRIAPRQYATQLTVLGVLYTVMPLTPYLLIIGTSCLATAAAIRLMSCRIESLIA